MERLASGTETHRPLALIVLAVFYGIYFGKMLAQKQHGIRTHQTDAESYRMSGS